MPRIISQPDVAKWHIDIMCNDMFRASQTTGNGCLAYVRFFAQDLQHSLFGSGTDNAGNHYYYGVCPNCGKHLLLHDREVPPYVQVALVNKAVPPPDPDLAAFFTGWQMELTCGGSKANRKNGCGQKLTIGASDVSYDDFARFDDHDYQYFVECPFCGHRNKIRPSSLPKFVMQGAWLKYKIRINS